MATKKPYVVGLCALLSGTGHAGAADRVSLEPWSGRVPPPPPLEPETLALARAPELSRRPVELVPELSLALSSCAGGGYDEQCRALGPAYGFGFTALHRPNAYFAFGGTASYAGSAGELSGAGRLNARTLGVALSGRVYLLERGSLDPYLELSLGLGDHRTTLAAAGVRTTTTAFGPAVRAGGGVDYSLGESLRAGIAAGMSTLAFADHEQCRSGRCQAGAATGSAVNGGLVAALRVTLALGDPL